MKGLLKGYLLNKANLSTKKLVNEYKEGHLYHKKRLRKMNLGERRTNHSLLPPINKSMDDNLDLRTAKYDTDFIKKDSKEEPQKNNLGIKGNK
jgi:hypothetical protein